MPKTLDNLPPHRHIGVASPQRFGQSHAVVNVPNDFVDRFVLSFSTELAADDVRSEAHDRSRAPGQRERVIGQLRTPGQP